MEREFTVKTDGVKLNIYLSEKINNALEQGRPFGLKNSLNIMVFDINTLTTHEHDGSELTVYKHKNLNEFISMVKIAGVAHEEFLPQVKCLDHFRRIKFLT